MVAAETGEEKVPGGHGWHTSARVAPKAVENVPGAHGLLPQEAMSFPPSTVEYTPGTRHGAQSEGAGAPNAVEYLPAGQRWQMSEYCAPRAVE